MSDAATPHRSPSSTRIPSLDGLRALSIFLVVMLHTLQRLGRTHYVPLALFGLFSGEAGVFLFFEISGFLITALLLEEYRRHGSIGLRAFFLRRAFRILPPLYLYIGTVVLLGWAGLLALDRSDVIGSLFFFHNFSANPKIWSLEHLWSISVEEQFYLVWPFAMVAALRRPGMAGRYAACALPAAVLVASPLARIALGISGSAELHQIGRRLNFDFLMFGCLAALLQHTRRFETVYRACTRIWWAPPAVMLGCNLLAARFGSYFDLSVGYTINGFAIAIFLLWCIRNPGSAVGRTLNWSPVVRVGVLSYSIYLWQTLFLHVNNGSVFGSLWLGRPPLNWVGFLCAAAISYWLVEQPALRLRVRLARALHL